MSEHRHECTPEELDVLLRGLAECDNLPAALQDPEAVYRRLAKRAQHREQEGTPAREMPEPIPIPEPAPTPTPQPAVNNREGQRRQPRAGSLILWHWRFW